ncbi:hypothetical protein ACEUDC_19960, partial [Aeromonas veronii]
MSKNAPRTPQLDVLTRVLFTFFEFQHKAIPEPVRGQFGARRESPLCPAKSLLVFSKRAFGNPSPCASA